MNWLKKLPQMVQIGLDWRQSKKIGKSVGLGAVSVLVVKLLLDQGMYPDAWRDVESVAIITAAISAGLNALRKLVLKQQ